MSRRHIRLLVLSVLVVAFTAIGVVVFAEWLATGTGEGNAAAGTAVELRVEPVASIGVDATRLVPGGTGDVEVVLFNDNPYAVEVREIVQDDPITSDQWGCDGDTGQVTYTTQTGSWVVPANGDLFVRLVDALAMGVDAANECQGAEFTVPLAVAGGSSTVTTTGPSCADGEGCDDGNACTTSDICSGGVCTGTPYVCDDGDPCTDDICDGIGGCAFVPSAGPSCLPDEVCDGVDNDLNGLVDDGLGSYCLSGIPAANTDGDSSCLGGFADFDGDPANGCEFAPSEEVCDGVDNDLDGSVDENWPVGETCVTPSGEGTWVCDSSGATVECEIP